MLRVKGCGEREREGEGVGRRESAMFMSTVFVDAHLPKTTKGEKSVLRCGGRY